MSLVHTQIGDDMGLGKTIQVICLLLAVYRKSGTLSDKEDIRRLRYKLTRGVDGAKKITPSLIVAPACLVDNWFKELVDWGYFSVIKSSRDIDGMIEALRFGYIEIVLISYEFMIKHIDHLKAFSFDLIIYDEGHKMCNTKTSVFCSAMELSSANCRIILTGTPMQNKIEEIGNLLTVVTNGKFLGGKDFKEHFVNPIKQMSTRSATEETRQRGQKRKVEFQALKKQYMLRRDKETELDLKGKDSIVVYCELSDLQRDLYKHILSLPDFDNARYHSTNCKSKN